MVDMGVPGYLVASSVIAVLAQRLVRTVCPRCKQRYTPRESVLEEAGLTMEDIKNAEFVRGKGCGHCQKKGYRGRTGIHELMIISSQIREMIFENRSSPDIRSTAIDQGMRTLYLDGLKKAMDGVTTLEEVFRVAKKTEQDSVVDISAVA
jgi:type IV pilus assembly protein PilB